MTQEEIDRFYNGLRNTNLTTVETIVKEYIKKGLSPISIVNEGLKCAVSLQTPIENLKAIVEATKEGYRN